MSSLRAGAVTTAVGDEGSERRCSGGSGGSSAGDEKQAGDGSCSDARQADEGMALGGGEGVVRVRIKEAEGEVGRDENKCEQKRSGEWKKEEGRMESEGTEAEDAGVTLAVLLLEEEGEAMSCGRANGGGSSNTLGNGVGGISGHLAGEEGRKGTTGARRGRGEGKKKKKVGTGRWLQVGLGRLMRGSRAVDVNVDSEDVSATQGCSALKEQGLSPAAMESVSATVVPLLPQPIPEATVTTMEAAVADGAGEGTDSCGAIQSAGAAASTHSLPTSALNDEGGGSETVPGSISARRSAAGVRGLLLKQAGSAAR